MWRLLPDKLVSLDSPVANSMKSQALMQTLIYPWMFGGSLKMFGRAKSQCHCNARMNPEREHEKDKTNEPGPSFTEPRPARAKLDREAFENKSNLCCVRRAGAHTPTTGCKTSWHKLCVISAWCNTKLTIASRPHEVDAESNSQTSRTWQSVEFPTRCSPHCRHTGPKSPSPPMQRRAKLE